MQKNGHGLRSGHKVLMEHEKNALDQLAEMKNPPGPQSIPQCDDVAIHCPFETTAPDGQKRIINEIALQH